MPFIRWAAALAAGTALAALTWPAAGSSANSSLRITRSPRASTSASAPGSQRSTSALSVRLHVSTTQARQLVGITLTAKPSSPGSYIYYFEYGDGVIEASTQPIASHAYRKPGTYEARVAIAGAGGESATSPSVQIRVRYGYPPHVAITTPAPNGTVRLGGRIAGVASDPTGIKRVQLAIQLLRSKTHYRTGGRCIWYGGHGGLVLSPCDAPYFFNVSHGHGHWSMRFPTGASLPAGIYGVRVRAIDNAGNISSAYYERLRTIVPFRLAR
jgi:hypothetical protein